MRCSLTFSLAVGGGTGYISICSGKKSVCFTLPKFKDVCTLNV